MQHCHFFCSISLNRVWFNETLLLNIHIACFSLLINSANNLDPDQDRQNVDLDLIILNPNCLTLIEYLKEFFEKVYFEKSQQMMTK